MSINLLELASSTLAPTLISKAGQLFGLNNSMAGKAIESILPTLLSGVLSKASTKEGAQAVFKAVNDHSVDANIGGNFANLLSTPTGVHNLGEQGGKILGMLFGDKANGLGDQVAHLADMPEQSKGIKGLLALAAPAIFGLLKNQITSNKLSPQGFSTLLASQAPHLEASLPAKIAEFLGWGSLASFFGGIGGKLTGAFDGLTGLLGDGVGAAASAVGATAALGGAVVKKTGGLMKWLLPLLLAAAAIAFLLTKYMGGSDKKPMPAAETPKAAVVVEAPKAVEPVKAAEPAKIDPAAAMGDAKTKFAAAIKALEGGKCDAAALSSAMGLYIINFGSGSAAIPAADQAALKTAVPAMKACTTSGVKIAVEGHTDNVGAPAFNQKLSEARAKSVTALFAGAGIKADALSAKGLGDTKAVGDNKTEAGRFANRRITYSAM